MKSVVYYQRLVFGAIFIGYSMYVLCRKSFAFVIPHVQAEEKLSKEDLGTIVSALNLAYAISKFLFGVLSDRVGAVPLFTSGLVATALSVVGFSYVHHSTSMFALLWFLNGLGQGCGWPACSKLLRVWFKPDQFGTWWSVLAASINVTGVVVPLFLPFLVLTDGGWRVFMFISGLISILWAFLCLFLVHESPESIGLPAFLTKKEEAKKRDENSEKHEEKTGSLNDLLSSPFLWLLSSYYLVVFAAKTSFENWAQLLLVDEKQLGSMAAVAFISAFETGGMAGSFATGYLTDLCVSRRSSSSHSNPRMTVSLAYITISVLGLHALVTSNIALPVVAFVLGFSLYGNINIFGIVATESAPLHLSGTSHSIVSLAANVGAVLAGYPFSVIAHYYGWTGVFALLEICCFSCLVLMLVSRGVSTCIGRPSKIKAA